MVGKCWSLYLLWWCPTSFIKALCMRVLASGSCEYNCFVFRESRICLNLYAYGSCLASASYICNMPSSFSDRYSNPVFCRWLVEVKCLWNIKHIWLYVLCLSLISIPDIMQVKVALYAQLNCKILELLADCT